MISRIYVINLASRPDRRREMYGELKRIELGAGDPEVDFFTAVRTDEVCAFPSIGAHGCFLGHLGVLPGALSLTAALLF